MAGLHWVALSRPGYSNDLVVLHRRRRCIALPYPPTSSGRSTTRATVATKRYARPCAPAHPLVLLHPQPCGPPTPAKRHVSVANAFAPPTRCSLSLVLCSPEQRGCTDVPGSLAVTHFCSTSSQYLSKYEQRMWQRSQWHKGTETH